MAKGFDADFALSKHADCLVKDGFEFVIRYYNINNHQKNLTLAEAHAMAAAKLQIAVVWENGNPTHSSFFNHAVGVHDGTAAYHFAKAVIGQSAKTPIYFAVDYDATEGDVNGVITDY